MAPRVFSIKNKMARVHTQPMTEEDVGLCEAVRAMCPRGAISVHPGIPPAVARQQRLEQEGKADEAKDVQPSEPEQHDYMTDSLYFKLYDEAEKVRWRMFDLPWDDLDMKRVTPTEVNLVRIMGQAENATFDATKQFIKLFENDPDFTQWVTIWVYEENKHVDGPMRWLQKFGETFDDDFLLAGRETNPMLDSRLRMLTMNIFSETIVTTAYRAFSEAARDPVIRAMTRYICADESRHAACFFKYAQRELAKSEQPLKDKLLVLDTAAFWLMNNMKTKHPAGLLYQEFQVLGDYTYMMPTLGVPRQKLADRLAIIMGRLVGEKIDTQQALLKRMFELREQVDPLIKKSGSDLPLLVN